MLWEYAENSPERSGFPQGISSRGIFRCKGFMGGETQRLEKGMQGLSTSTRCKASHTGKAVLTPSAHGLDVMGFINEADSFLSNKKNCPVAEVLPRLCLAISSPTEPCPDPDVHGSSHLQAPQPEELHQPGGGEGAGGGGGSGGAGGVRQRRAHPAQLLQLAAKVQPPERPAPGALRHCHPPHQTGQRPWGVPRGGKERGQGIHGGRGGG